jgi:hypothetical protein
LAEACICVEKRQTKTTLPAQKRLLVLLWPHHEEEANYHGDGHKRDYGN